MSQRANKSSRSTISTPSMDFGVRFQPRMPQPKPCRRLTVASPIGPKPTMPTVAWLRSLPKSKSDCQPLDHCPVRIHRSASATRRVVAIINPTAKSAVLSTNTPGVCPTGMPAAVAAARSMWSTPTEIVEMTFNCSAPARTDAVIGVDSAHSNPRASPSHSRK